jgi:hypothetical protein
MAIKLTVTWMELCRIWSRTWTGYALLDQARDKGGPTLGSRIRANVRNRDCGEGQPFSRPRSGRLLNTRTWEVYTIGMSGPARARHLMNTECRVMIFVAIMLASHDSQTNSVVPVHEPYSAGRSWVSRSAERSGTFYVTAGSC